MASPGKISVLRDLVPFVHVKNRENDTFSLSFSKIAGSASNFTKNNTSPCFSSFLNCANGNNLRKASHSTFFDSGSSLYNFSTFQKLPGFRNLQAVARISRNKLINVNTLTTTVPHQIETSQLICIRNQLIGLYMMGNIGC